MSGLLDRAASVFVEPRPRAERASAAEAPPRFASRALRPRRAPPMRCPLAAALAGGLREREGAAGAVLVVWPAADAAAAGARDAGGGAARWRGFSSRARSGRAGRLAWLALGGADLALARRAPAAVDVPAVIAITGPAPPRPTSSSPSRTRSSSSSAHRRGPAARPTWPGPGFAECNVPLTDPRAARPRRARATTALAGWGRREVPA